MPESGLFFTRFFNDYLAAPGNAALVLVGKHAEARPWADFIVMQLLVVVTLMLLFALLRPKLSADKPGKFQQIFELLYGFVRDQAEDQVGHTAHRYVAFFGVIFLYVLSSNLIGLIPCFESPTMNPSVTAGCALATFAYYNLKGLQVKRIRYG